MGDGVYCGAHYRDVKGKSQHTYAHMVYHYQCSSQFGIVPFSSLSGLSWLWVFCTCRFPGIFLLSIYRCLLRLDINIGFVYNISVMEVDNRTCHWNVGIIVVSQFDIGKRPLLSMSFHRSKQIPWSQLHCFVVGYFPSSCFQCILFYNLVAIELNKLVVMMGPFLLSFSPISNVKMEFPEPLEPSFTTSIQVLCNHSTLMEK